MMPATITKGTRISLGLLIVLTPAAIWLLRLEGRVLVAETRAAQAEKRADLDQVQHSEEHKETMKALNDVTQRLSRMEGLMERIGRRRWFSR